MNTTEKLADMLRLLANHLHTYYGHESLRVASLVHDAREALAKFDSERQQAVDGAGAGAVDHTPLLRMIAGRARAFPWLPMGHHLFEVFKAIGEEPPPLLALALPPAGVAVAWPSGIDIADEIDSLLPASMGYSTRAAVEVWWRDLVARKLSKLAAPAPAVVPAELAAFDLAVAEELPRVSHVEYDSHEICNHFAGKVRDRMLAASHPPSTERGWLPIETAPKDGSKILLFYLNANGKARRVVGGWVTEEEAAETDTDGVGLEAGWYERIDNWGDFYQVAIHEGEPTHWMPLPAAPNQKGAL